MLSFDVPGGSALCSDDGPLAGPVAQRRRLRRDELVAYSSPEEAPGRLPVPSAARRHLRFMSVEWAAELSLHDNHVQALAVGDDGTIYLAGSVYQPFDLGGGVGIAAPEEGASMVIALSSSGAPRWAQMLDADLMETYGDGISYDGGMLDASALAAAPEGGLVVAGTFHGAVDFGGGVVASEPWGGVAEYDTWYGGADDVFVLGLDAGGAYRWHEAFGGPHAQAATSVTAVGGDRVVVAGSGQGALAPYYEGFAVGFAR